MKSECLPPLLRHFHNDEMDLLLLLLIQYFQHFEEYLDSIFLIDGVSDCRCFKAMETADSPEKGKSTSQ